MRFAHLVILGLLAMSGRALSPATAATSNAETTMHEGIDEFRSGAFARALEKFLQARAAGLDTPVLRYNLGATYYKLGQDDQAAAQFESLLADPKFSDFARSTSA